jgi:succinate-semialdehyde dehydrogenase/glutarate-semialdehyde dehydrogenase
MEWTRPPEWGRLSTSGRLQEIDAIIQDAVSEGAKVECGGRRPADINTGHFYEPTVLTSVSDDMRVFAEENFGPIAAIAGFRMRTRL